MVTLVDCAEVGLLALLVVLVEFVALAEFPWVVELARSVVEVVALFVLPPLRTPPVSDEVEPATVGGTIVDTGLLGINESRKS